MRAVRNNRSIKTAKVRFIKEKLFGGVLYLVRKVDNIEYYTYSLSIFWGRIAENETENLATCFFHLINTYSTSLRRDEKMIPTSTRKREKKEAHSL